MKKGIPVSPGFAIGRAFCISPKPAPEEVHGVAEEAIAGEVAHFNEACAAAARELDDIIARVAQQLSEEEADIFRAHRALLQDPALVEKVNAAIRARPASFDPFKPKANEPG